MPAAERKGDANGAGGRIVGNCASTVFINGKPAGLIGSTVSPHQPFKTPHKPTPRVVGGSKTVFAEGRGVSYKGAADSCGHSRAEASPNVFVGG
jgi:uncharacterized Zn-binding protein involved in type VI secretion